MTTKSILEFSGSGYILEKYFLKAFYVHILPFKKAIHFSLAAYMSYSILMLFNMFFVSLIFRMFFGCTRREVIR